MKIIFDYNRTLYDPKTKALYPGTLKLLNKLAKKHHLYLVSRAEFGREYQFKTFGLAPLFKKMMLINQVIVAQELMNCCARNNQMLRKKQPILEQHFEPLYLLVFPRA